jgi:hypothetical protein
MLSNVSSSVFTNSESVTLVPSVSAEWNHNLFNSPYITTAGVGTKVSGNLTTGTASTVTVGAKENFTTKSFQMSGGTGSVEYTVPGLSGLAYKIVTYVKTNSPAPVMISTYAKGSESQFGSEQAEATSLKWTKIVTYVGSKEENISSLTYKILANSFAEENNNALVYFTLPEIYQTTIFDYKNASLFPTDSVFSYFRPGESYVPSGNASCSFSPRHRRIASKVLGEETETTISGSKFFGNKYMPVTPIIQNPSFFLASPGFSESSSLLGPAVLKSALPTDINPYKYFVSDPLTSSPSYNPSITAIYEEGLVTNKLVIKFNTLMTVPTFNLYINESLVTATITTAATSPVTSSVTALSPIANSDGYNTGVIVLYWSGTNWTNSPWLATDMPKFQADGSLNKTTIVNKIRITQIGQTVNPALSHLSTSDSASADLKRMHLIEVSPRLEIDLSDFVSGLELEKSLDGANTVLPISSMNSNDVTLTFSGIPGIKNGSVVPIFSNQSDNSLTILSNMLRNNIKFYVNFNLLNSTSIGTLPTVYSNMYIPAGIFYSDSWQENDIQDVTVQAYDVSKYLQSKPVSDYVANLKTVFQVITDILDLSGFTDYDYDSLYKICNNKSQPLDISYYYANSRDKTVIEALNDIFLAYQIGAYIDEYGIMRFISLFDILSNTSTGLSISEANIEQGGVSVSNKQKPGKISLRYQTPRIKQSPSLQNVKNLSIKDSPSFIYTTSNDVVWEQQSAESLGFNYLEESMTADSNTLSINKNDLLDIFHTFNMDANGYVCVEGEIMSFQYKQYTLSSVAYPAKSKTISIKNSLELSAAIADFIKVDTLGLKTNNNQELVEGVRQTQESDILIGPTGKITNVQRGMYGTLPTSHSRITSLSSKGLLEKTINSSLAFSSSTGNTSITNNHDNLANTSLPNVTKIGLISQGSTGTKVAVCPSSETSRSYKTYSVKFDIPDQSQAAAGLYINQSSTGSLEPLFIEMIKFSKIDTNLGIPYDPPQYTYIMAIYDSTQLYSYADVSSECNRALNKLPRIFKNYPDAISPNPKYGYVFDPVFNLRVAIKETDGLDGENGTLTDKNTALSIFLNNIEITTWQVPDTSTSIADWKAPEINKRSRVRQKPTVPNLYGESKSFGFYASSIPRSIPDVSYPGLTSAGSVVANLREIHATERPLMSRSAGYFYQETEFLNGIVQNQLVSLNSLSYIMQTTPEVSGISYYDVQYSTPAACSVDFLPVQYAVTYHPGNTKEQQAYALKKIVTQESVSYSTPLNTGFRARMALANNSPHVVLLTNEPSEVVKTKVNLKLWTNEIISSSEPDILEAVIDDANQNDVAQLDSEWVQSKFAGEKMLKIVESALDGFSTTTQISIFGNPLIQIGDPITLSYILNGMVNQKHVVTAISHSFSNGLKTSLTLSRIKE